MSNFKQLILFSILLSLATLVTGQTNQCYSCSVSTTSATETCTASSVLNSDFASSDPNFCEMPNATTPTSGSNYGCITQLSHVVSGSGYCVWTISRYGTGSATCYNYCLNNVNNPNYAVCTSGNASNTNVPTALTTQYSLGNQNCTAGLKCYTCTSVSQTVTCGTSITSANFVDSGSGTCAVVSTSTAWQANLTCIEQITVNVWANNQCSYTLRRYGVTSTCTTYCSSQIGYPAYANCSQTDYGNGGDAGTLYNAYLSNQGTCTETTTTTSTTTTTTTTTTSTTTSTSTTSTTTSTPATTVTVVSDTAIFGLAPGVFWGIIAATAVVLLAIIAVSIVGIIALCKAGKRSYTPKVNPSGGSLEIY